MSLTIPARNGFKCMYLISSSKYDSSWHNIDLYLPWYKYPLRLCFLLKYNAYPVRGISAVSIFRRFLLKNHLFLSQSSPSTQRNQILPFINISPWTLWSLWDNFSIFMSNLLGVNFAFLTCKKPLSVERAGGKFFSLIIFLVGVFTREMPPHEAFPL